MPRKKDIQLPVEHVMGLLNNIHSYKLGEIESILKNPYRHHMEIGGELAGYSDYVEKALNLKQINY